jgi:hypothetical protein
VQNRKIGESGGFVFTNERYQVPENRLGQQIQDSAEGAGLVCLLL